MSQNLNAAAVAANLAEQDRKKVEAYQKALNTHKTLSNLPSDIAQQQVQKLGPDKQQSLVDTFGNEDLSVKPQTGWLQTAGGYVAKGFGLGLAGLQNVSDFSTRLYRTGAIALTQNKSLNDAWDDANDKGDKVFDPNRIDSARAKFGNDAVTVAIRLASVPAGEDPGKILAESTPEQEKYLQLANKKAGTKEEQDLFQDTLNAVNAAKYSPGRQFANAFFPADWEGSGFFYKAVSGAVDAAYRVLADPLIVGGKVKKLYDLNKYSVEVITGSAAKDGVAFNNYFNQTKTVNFWNDYGAKLKAYREADVKGDTLTKVAINKELARLAPEFGDSVIQTFNKAALPIEDVNTAKAFFQNAKQLDEMLKGAGGRRRVIAPRLTAGRKARVAALTTVNKVFNIDEVGPQLVNAKFFGEDATDEGVYKAIVDGKEQIVTSMQAVNSTRKVGVARFSTADIMTRIDRFKQKFTIAPLFENNQFDVIAADASTSIYRMARLALPQREAKLAAEVFKGLDVGERKEFYKGLWANIAEIRGINTSEPLKDIARIVAGKGPGKYTSRIDDSSDIGAFASDFTTKVTVPSIADLDRAAARSTLGQTLLGPVVNNQFLEKMVGAWSFFTLAGPRYAVRNSIEDLMVNLAIGESPWGIASSRRLTTRVLTSLEQTKGFGFEELSTSPLGFVLRTVNRSEAETYSAQIKNIDTVITTNKAEIKKIRLKIEKTTDQRQITNYKNRIAKLEKEMGGDVVKQTRQIMASALTKGRLNSFRETLGMKPLNQEGVDFLTEQIVYGDIENLLSVISEGGYNFASGADFLTSAVNFTQKHGVRSERLRLIAPKNKYTKAAGKAGFTNVALDPLSETSMVTWLLRLSYVSNDELGALAVSYLDDEAEAVAQIVKALKQNPELVDMSMLKAKGRSVEEHARTVYDRTREVFETRKDLPNGQKEINLDLLNKVRSIDDKTKRITNPNAPALKVSGTLSLSDLPKDELLTPRTIVGPELVPVTDSGNFTASLMDNGWRWLGMSNSRMSRQPIVINEMLTIRKQMRKSGFEDAWIQSYTKGINPAEKELIDQSIELAKRDLARVVEERALGQTLAYIDNPLIRTQIAFSSRNFARFYRATEDFYRRITRAVKYNPEAIAVAALTYEGISHSGWVQEDDQGEKYFIYPGIAPVYNAYQKMLNLVGLGNEFKTPFPVQFGAQLKMLTPSGNPDSLVPTFAGPVAGASIKTLEAIVNIWSPGAADTITRYTLGKYAVDQPVLSALLPAHINRLYGAMNKDERDGQYASAHRKAVTYLEAAGYGLPERYNADGTLIPPSDKELEDYRLRVKNATISILGMRFVFGFFAPASPQVQLKSDMAEWMRDSGRANFKQVWNDLKDEYGSDYDAAMAKWVKLYPDQIPFTVSESERKTVAIFGYAEEAGQFVDQNQDLFKNYPQGAAFLIPHKSGFSWDAYKAMTDMGLRKNLRVDEHLLKVQTAAARQEYYDRKDEYESQLERVSTDYSRSKLRKDFTEWKTKFFAGHPLVAQELSQASQSAIERVGALSDLELMLRDDSVRARSPKTFDALKNMLDVYLNYKNQRDKFDRYGGSQDRIRRLKDNTIVRLRELSQFNENTLSAYDSLFGSLLGD